MNVRMVLVSVCAALLLGLPAGANVVVPGVPTGYYADGFDGAVPGAELVEDLPQVAVGTEYVVIVGSLGDVADGDVFHGARVLWTYASSDGIFQFLVAAVLDETGFRTSVIADDNVIVADVNRPTQALFVPNDPCYNGVGCSISQYGPQLIGAQGAWDRTLGTTAVKVGIADTGVNKLHNDIGYSSRSVAEKDCIDAKKDVKDGNGHGSHVTGIAMATTNNGIGIAGLSQSSMIIVQVLNNAGSGSDASLACGVDFVRTSGGHIVSMSLGANGVLSASQTALRNFWNNGNGGLPVAATGNEGCNGSNCVDFPGNMAEVVGVGAVDSAKVRASFSNGGPEIDIAAPGVDIWSTWKSCQGSSNCYARVSGTSQATPHVAGVAALVKSLNSGFTAQQVRDRLLTTAEDRGAAGWDSMYGNGMVRADLAVT